MSQERQGIADGSLSSAPGQIPSDAAPDTDKGEVIEGWSSVPRLGD